MLDEMILEVPVGVKNLMLPPKNIALVICWLPMGITSCQGELRSRLPTVPTQVWSTSSCA